MAAVPDDAERAALVALLRLRPERMTWAQITAEITEAGSARAVWERCVGGDLFDHAAASHPVLVDAAADVALWNAADFAFLTVLDAEYPARLRDVHQVPPVLFARGTLLTDDLGVCVVGSRRASSASLDFAAHVATGLVDRSLTVVSGLALGIDTAAHQAALDAGGRTVAVIGTGIERQYPAENSGLQRRIERDGLVLSQFWPDAPPTKQSFPLRNAVMSAYGRATIVVEAGETSGARIQARLAVEHGRPVILTSQVVATTAWGRALVSNPGVSVAASPEAALAAVDAVLSAERSVEALLARSGG